MCTQIACMVYYARKIHPAYHRNWFTEGVGWGEVGGAEMHRGGREVFDYLGEQVVQGLVYTSRSPS